MSSVASEFSVSKVMDSISGAVSKAQFILDTQVAKDTDAFVPFDTGMLAQSVFRSPFGSGRLYYDTPYARAVYENARNRRFQRTPHMKASDHWFEAAKARFKDDWLKLAARLMEWHP